MSPHIQNYLDLAEYCERAATMVTSPDAIATFLRAARNWHEMAEQDRERERAETPYLGPPGAPWLGHQDGGGGRSRAGTAFPKLEAYHAEVRASSARAVSISALTRVFDALWDGPRRPLSLSSTGGATMRGYHVVGTN